MKKKVFYFLILTLLTLSLYFSLKFFTLNSVSCYLEDKDSCGQDLTTTLDKTLLQQSLFFTDFETVLTSEPLASLPYTLVSYQKKLPNQIQVTFVEETLQYFLRTTDGQRLAVGTEGSIVNLAQNDGQLPEIQINKTHEELSANKKLNPEIHNALAALLNSLYKYQLSFQNIEWNSANEIEFSLKTGQKVILAAENPQHSIEKLQLILDSAEIKTIEEPINEIDLRFEMPVLRTSK